MSVFSPGPCIVLSISNIKPRDSKVNETISDLMSASKVMMYLTIAHLPKKLLAELHCTYMLGVSHVSMGNDCQSNQYRKENTDLLL